MKSHYGLKKKYLRFLCNTGIFFFWLPKYFFLSLFVFLTVYCHVLDEIVLPIFGSKEAGQAAPGPEISQGKGKGKKAKEPAKKKDDPCIYCGKNCVKGCVQ